MWLAFPTITLPWEGSGLGQAGQTGALGTCLQGLTAAPAPGDAQDGHKEALWVHPHFDP